MLVKFIVFSSLHFSFLLRKLSLDLIEAFVEAIENVSECWSDFFSDIRLRILNWTKGGGFIPTYIGFLVCVRIDEPYFPWTRIETC